MELFVVSFCGINNMPCVLNYFERSVTLCQAADRLIFQVVLQWFNLVP